MSDNITILGNATIINGEVLETLRNMPAESVHCVVTSPPYWGLRDYGVKGMIGLESTFWEYLDKMIRVCEEIRRVLRKDGTFWLNMGDGYASGGNGGGGKQDTNRDFLGVKGKAKRTSDGFKSKDLLLMPARLAIALQESGWWIRSEIVWAKPNPMPESVTDRPTSAHEKIFLLTRSAKYFYDADAVREPHEHPEVNHQSKLVPRGCADAFMGNPPSNIGRCGNNPFGRNLRNVWTISTRPYPEAHFATFPEEIPLKCIMAGTSERGCCEKCGSPWVRIVETTMKIERKDTYQGKQTGQDKNYSHKRLQMGVKAGREAGLSHDNTTIPKRTVGWQPSCQCNAGIVPCTVLDPFSGSGTTGLVALKLNRCYIGIELNPEYIELSKKRLINESLQMKMSINF